MLCGRCCVTEPPTKLALRLDIFIEILPRTRVNKPPVDAPDTAGWHHARCRGGRETGVGQKEGILCDLRGREEQGLGPPLT